LEKEHNLLRTAVTVTWKGEGVAERMKELGSRTAVVKVDEGGREEMLLDVVVVRLDEAGQGSFS